MGKLIREAREESGISQRDLAKKIFRRQAALSEMENGLMQPDAETLLSLAYTLEKPASFFFPFPFKTELAENELSEKEAELLIQARKLTDEDLERIIIQVKALAKKR